MYDNFVEIKASQRDPVCVIDLRKLNSGRMTTLFCVATNRKHICSGKKVAQIKILNVKNSVKWFLLLILFFWGLRRIILEGFVYAIPRNFGGDFYTAMYEFTDTPGVEMLYGPIFLIEQYFAVYSSPYFSINFFAFLNVVLVIIALIFTLLACRSSRIGSAIIIVLWCLFSPLFYSLSVASNPEFLELALLCGAWFFLKKQDSLIPWILIPLAIVTKLIPVIFLPLLFFHFKRRGFSLSIVTGILVISIASLLSSKNPFLILIALVFPQIPTGYTTSVSGISLIMNPPITMQFLGLNSALWRLFDLESKDEATQTIVSLFSIVLIFSLYAWIVFIAYRLIRKTSNLPVNLKYSLIFGLLFAFMPLATMQAHPHTFLFLLPCIGAIVLIIAHESNQQMRRITTLFSIIIYTILGGSFILVPLDRLLGKKISDSAIFQEPIWATVMLVIFLAFWAEHVRKSSTKVSENRIQA